MSGPIILFITLSLLFQLAALKTYGKELLWVATDYIWLTVAAIALIFYAVKGEQYLMEKQLKDSEPQYEMSHFMNHMFFETNVRIHSFIGILKDKKEIESSVSDQSEDASTLAKRLERLSAPMSDDDWNKFLRSYSYNSLTDGLKDPQVRETATSIENIIISAKERLKKRDEMKAFVANPTPKENELFKYPFVLAFPLSLRLGRTTADLLRKLSAKYKTSSDNELLKQIEKNFCESITELLKRFRPKKTNSSENCDDRPRELDKCPLEEKADTEKHNQV